VIGVIACIIAPFFHGMAIALELAESRHRQSA
jgi:hypothetical protein